MPPFRFKNYVNSDSDARSGSMWKKLVKHRLFRMAMGVAAGAVVGLLYWKFVGCHSGTCPLTSNPMKTVILFSFMGGLLAHNKQAEKNAVK